MDPQTAAIVAGGVVGGAVLLAFVSCSVAYLLFQKHCLNAAGNKCSSRFFLWSCMGFTACNQKCIKKGWWQEIDDKVYVGAVPLKCLGHVRKLAELGVRGVVNTMDEYSGPVDAYESFGIEQLHLPVIDHMAPSFQQTVQGVDFIQRIVNSGGSVLIHCKGGHGRSAAIGFAWLLKNRQMSLEEAQTHIRSRRKVRKKLFRQAELIRFHRKYVLGLDDDEPPSANDDGADLEEGSVVAQAGPKHANRRAAGKPSKSLRILPVDTTATTTSSSSSQNVGEDQQDLDASHFASPRKKSKIVPSGALASGPASPEQQRQAGEHNQRQSPRKKSQVMPMGGGGGTESAAADDDAAAAKNPTTSGSTKHARTDVVAPALADSDSDDSGGSGDDHNGRPTSDRPSDNKKAPKQEKSSTTKKRMILKQDSRVV